MRRSNIFLPVIIMMAFITISEAQVTTNHSALSAISSQNAIKWEALRGPEYLRLKSITTGPQGILNATENLELIGVDISGRPWFFQTNNLNAARTISTIEAWPDGNTGFDLTGGDTERGELGVWDGGRVRNTHQELTGRVYIEDGAGAISNHSTHVAGTMIAEGVDANAIGMSYEAELSAYEWTSDDAEMADAANDGMKVSNHSYGLASGWHFSNPDWYWYGDFDISTTEEYGFGFYSSQARSYDNIAYNAPYYTILKSAGNDRNEGPPAGTQHYYWNNGWTLSTTTRDVDGGDDGYDCVSYAATAKNIITVGAIYDIVNGYSEPDDVEMSNFSCWGPTDDGRIKPDLVANGISLRSSYGTGNAEYANYSGTSMATPNAAGSLNLLVEHYENTHDGDSPRSATMKSLLINTADEAGEFDGPDYEFGWGLINIETAAEVIYADTTDDERIFEEELAQNGEDEYTLFATGNEPLNVTIAWTDPPGPTLEPSLNPTTIILRNDLDMVLTHLETENTYQPYILDPENPANAASTGDNDLDNVEKIYIAEPLEGEYSLVINHDGILTQAPQAYSLVIGGVGGNAPPTTDPPSYLTASLDDLTGNAMLDWWPNAEDHSEMIYYDDGESDGGYYFNEDATDNSTMGVRFSPPSACLLIQTYAFINFDPDIPLNDVSFRVWDEGDNNNEPGDDLFTSETLEPEGGNWLILDISDENLRFEDDFWVTLMWENPGGPVLGFNVDGEINLRSYYSTPPYNNWVQISEDNGLADAEMMIRALVLAEDEDGMLQVMELPPQANEPAMDIRQLTTNTRPDFIEFAPHLGGIVPLPDLDYLQHRQPGELDEFIQYMVYKDGEVLDSTEDTYYEDNLSDYDTFEYIITALYDEGESENEGPVEVTWTASDPAPENFEPVDPSGIPYVIWVDEATVDGFDLEDGDEIGIFDGDLCVGTGIIPEDEVLPVPVVVWGANEQINRDGFEDGNDISFILWVATGDFEIEADADFDNGNGTFGDDDFAEVSLESFTVPLEFDLEEPEDEATIIELDVQLGWEEAVDPDPNDPVEYNVFVSTNPNDLGDPVAENLDETSYEFTGDDDTEYHWRILAIDSYDNNRWSTSQRSFYIEVPETPEDFTLVSPEDESTVFTLRPTLEWNPTTDPDPDEDLTYTVLWAIDDPTFETADSVEGLEETTYTFDEQLAAQINAYLGRARLAKTNRTNQFLPEPGNNVVTKNNETNPGDELDELEDDVTVYWRIHAVDSNTEGTLSIPRNGWSFDVYIYEAPEPFSLRSPEDEEIVDTLLVELAWNASADPDPGDTLTYVVLLATGEDFADSVEYEAGEETSLIVDGLDDDSEYWWKVRADNLFGDPVYSTETWSFATAMPEPPAAFALIAPADGDTVTAVQVWNLHFIWNASIDPDPNAEILYSLAVTVNLNDGTDTSVVVSGIEDTTWFLNLPDTLGMAWWDNYLVGTWRVEAVSGTDTARSEEDYSFRLEPYLNINDYPYEGIPLEFGVVAAYPNPFNPTVQAVVAVPRRSIVQVEIYNMLGRSIAQLSPGELKPGYHRISWTAEGPSGLYFLHFTNDSGWREVRKVVYMK
ncbi:MAG: S8 family serine peptidase [Candidatus Electryonea clarkiae]|nr:S8 family serine peptidase [Candidatus Electryonea clarkiae]MDP8288857.1 S8 family serine peptidase [Candidatus Electryonea clarkiae]